MAINYTTLLGLAQPVTGTESNVWGDVVNDSITALLDSAIAGTATINVTSGSVTLTDVDGAADQARMAILVLTGTPGVTTNVVAPSRSKTYIVVNQSNASAVLKGSATSGVTIRAGQAATCVWNGSDFEIVASGDVDGPSSATDNAVVRYDGTTGKLVQNSGVTIDDSNNVTGITNLAYTGTLTGGTGVINIGSGQVYKDASGNVGIGTASPSVRLSFGTNSNQTFALFENPGGANLFGFKFTSGSGTDRISVISNASEAVSILNTGYVGVGTIAPGVKFDVANGDIRTTGALLSYDGTTNSRLISFGGASFFGTTTNHPIIVQTNNTERMKIDTSGNVGIGTSSPAVKLDVAGEVRSTSGTVQLFMEGVSGSGGYLGTRSNDFLQFRTNNTNVMNITAAGNVGIGTTSPTFFGATYTTLEVKGKSGTVGGYILASAADGSAVAQMASESSVSYIGSRTNTPVAYTTNNAERMRITAGGEVYIAGTTDQGAYNLQVNGTGVWGAGAYVNGSDERLKDNIQTLNDGLSVINQLRPVTFQYKPDYSKDTAIQPGFIAQELQAALEGKDYVDGVVQAGPEYLNVAYQNLIPLLVKSIQEQQAIITDLQTRLTALEGN